LPDTARYLPASILPALFAVVAASVFTRIFSPAEYGVYSLVIAVTGPLTMVLSEWIAQPVGRFFAEYERRGRAAELRRIVVSVSYLVAALIVVLSVLIGSALALAGGAILLPMVFFGAASGVLTQSLTAVALPILNARMEIAAYRFVVVASSGLAVGIPIALVYLIGKDVAWLLWGQAAAGALMLPFVYSRTGLRLIRPAWPLSPRLFHTLRRLWRYGVPMMLWFVSAGILNAEDRYVIQLFRGPAEVGVYGVNYGLIAGLSGLINTPVIIAAGPILYKLWADRQFHLAGETIKRMTELYLVIALAMLGGIIVAGRPIVGILLGEEFRSGAVILAPVLIGRILWGASNIGHKGLELQEKTLRMVWNALVAAGTNLVLNLLLVPRFGYVAAAYTTLVSYLAYAWITWWQTRRTLAWRLDPRAIAVYTALMLAASVGARFLLTLFGPSGNAFQALFGGGLFIVLYILLLLALMRRRVIQLFVMGDIS